MPPVRGLAVIAGCSVCSWPYLTAAATVVRSRTHFRSAALLLFRMKGTMQRGAETALKRR